MLRITRFLAFAAVALLVTAGLSAPSADAAEKYTRGLRYPSVTPDGKQVVFAYRGDIWITDTDGKSPARRLTIHEAQDTLPRVSPDGKHIAFSSTREGSYDLYVMPITGGEAKRVSYHSGLEIMCNWSPDSKHLLFASNRAASRYRIDLYEMPATGGPARRITRDGGRDGSYSEDGKHIVYVRGFNTIYQDNYVGSANYDIYTIERAGGMPQRVLRSEGNERFPHFSKDGKWIWFVAEEKGVANFYAVPNVTDGTAGKKRKQLSRLTGNDVQRPALSADGKTIVYERWGRLYTMNLATEKPKEVELKLVVKGDRRHSGREKRTIDRGAQQVHLSKDGQTMVFSNHGDLWMSSGNGGKARRLTSGPNKDEWPRISPNGQTIAFQSDRSGNSDLWLLDMRSGKTSQLTTNKAGDFFHNWSPDGSKLVFCSERSGNRDIWTIDVKTKKATQITKHPAGDDDPSFSPDGRSIAFDSAREGNQAIYVMDAAGGNVRRVTNGTSFKQVPSWSPDGSLLCFEVFNQTNGRSGGLYVVSSAGGPEMQISRDGSTACWSPRGDYIYFSVGATGREEIYRVPAPKTVENREKVPFTGTVEVDVRQELANLFDEAWVTLGNGFYDAKMHGVDWKKMREKYRGMAIDAENKDEFHNVIRQMLAELNASHLGIFGGSRPSNAVRASTPATGYLGLEFADKTGPNGGRTVASVYSKGPADQAGIRVGDEVIAIQGKKVDASTDVDRMLAGTVGKEVRVRFRPITADGVGDAREEKVKPMSAGQYRTIQSVRWVAGNGNTVRKETKGQIGYIHLSAMNPQNLQKFQRTVANWNRRSRIKGMIIDVRENGGGNIHQQLMQILQARPYARVSMRGSPIKVTQPALYWDKPVVVLINERSFSDAEVFPYIFKTMGVGKVIGVPTPGGVIGTNDITLSDGSSFRIPRTRYEGMDGTNLEGHGVKPDILVEMTSEDRIKGRDPQLKKAIEVVMAEVKSGAKPSTKPATKPSTKPATKPTTTEPRPERPDDGANRTGSAMDPLADAKVGEWVRFEAQLPNVPDKTTMKLRVVEVSKDEVRFERELESGPAIPLPMPAATPRRPLLEAIAGMGQVKSHETRTMQVKGETVEVAVVTLEAFGGNLKMTFSNAVPAMGLLKVEIGKNTVLKALEWGIDEPEATTEAKPEPKPEPKPAATMKPVPGPNATAKPAAATPAQGPANPIHDAKVGEWVRMRTVIQGEEAVATLRVVEVADDVVWLQTELAYGGKQMQGRRVARPRRERIALRGRRGGGAATVSTETVEVKGKKLECVVITRKGRGDRVDKRWYAKDVPVDGLVRHECNGTVVRELLDWGTNGQPPASPVQGK